MGCRLAGASLGWFPPSPLPPETIAPRSSEAPRHRHVTRFSGPHPTGRASPRCQSLLPLSATCVVSCEPGDVFGARRGGTMKNRRLAIYATAGVGGLAMVAMTAWWAWTSGREVWWSNASGWSLDEPQAAALASCNDPGWMGLLRVLHQDLDDACGPSWFARTMQPHLEGTGHKLRMSWLRTTYQNDTLPVRVRYRAGQALLLRGDPVPGFALLSRTPELVEARHDLVRMVGEGELAPEPWADPRLAGEAALYQLDDDDALPVVASVLRHEALFQTGDADRRAWMTESTLARLGLSDGVLEEMLRRRAEGLPVHELTPELATVVLNRGEACRERSSAACLAFAADLLDASSPPTSPPAATVPPSSLPLVWHMLDARRPEATAVRAQWFTDKVTWLRQAEGAERDLRLAGMVTGGPDASDAIRAGDAGDPSITLRRRSDGPWMTALVAISLGEAISVPVLVASVDDRVGIDFNRVRLTIDACGRAHAVAPEERWSDPWPQQAIVAQATAEAAHAALRRGDESMARRLAAAARRWDPQGVAELAGLTEPASTTDRDLGAAVSAAILPPTKSRIETHKAERQAMAARRAERDEALACGRTP